MRTKENVCKSIDNGRIISYGSTYLPPVYCTKRHARWKITRSQLQYLINALQETLHHLGSKSSGIFCQRVHSANDCWVDGQEC